MDPDWSFSYGLEFPLDKQRNKNHPFGEPSMPKSITLLTVILLLFAGQTIFGQKQPLKGVYRFPTKNIGLTLELWQQLKEQRLEAEATIDAIMWEDKSDLQSAPNTIEAFKKAPLKLQLALAEIATGTSKLEPAPDANLLVQPAICRLMDKLVYSLFVVDLSSHQLYAGAHTVFPIEVDLKKNQAWEERLAEKLPPEEQAIWAQLQQKKPWPPQITKLWEGIQTALASPPPDSSALQIGLTLGRQTTRQDEGNSLCLNLLLSQELIKKGFEISFPLSLEKALSLNDLLNPNIRPLRATRRAITYWHWPKKPKATPKGVKLTLKHSIGTAVFAGEASPMQEEAVTLMWNETQNQFSLSPPAKLTSWMQKEQAKLRHQDPPKIVKINRAWVYLDRGRAYGLKLNDRLIFENPKVNGHVVGFYGKDAKIKNQEGDEIFEGAIVFIRNGQRQTRLGLRAQLDLKSFPTPWPPPE